MKIHDVSVTLSTQLPTWPGDPKIYIERVSKIEEGALANISRLDMGVHTGTHIDAPYHFVPDGQKVDSLPLDLLIGPALVVEIPASVNQIDAESLRALKLPAGFDRLLFKTRNSQIWAAEEKTFHPDFIAVTQDGAEYLIDLGVRLVGIDYLSIAPFDSPNPTHVAFLAAGVVIIEGLDLSGVDPGSYQLVCLPLKLGGAEGAPARVVLIEE